jgi:hypothetical protein
MKKHNCVCSVLVETIIACQQEAISVDTVLVQNFVWYLESRYFEVTAYNVNKKQEFFSLLNHTIQRLEQRPFVEICVKSCCAI